MRRGAPVAAPRRVFGAAASFVVADILADRGARAATFGLDNPLATRVWSAAKTGTSKDMRDNWCIGFTSRYTVGVWVGNFSGAPMHDVSGVTGAAPVFRDSCTSCIAARRRCGRRRRRRGRAQAVSVRSRRSRRRAANGSCAAPPCPSCAPRPRRGRRRGSHAAHSLSGAGHGHRARPRHPGGAPARRARRGARRRPACAGAWTTSGCRRRAAGCCGRRRPAAIAWCSRTRGGSVLSTVEFEVRGVPRRAEPFASRARANVDGFAPRASRSVSFAASLAAHAAATPCRAGVRAAYVPRLIVKFRAAALGRSAGRTGGEARPRDRRTARPRAHAGDRCGSAHFAGNRQRVGCRCRRREPRPASGGRLRRALAARVRRAHAQRSPLRAAVLPRSGAAAIDAVSAWDVTLGSPAIVVAVLDTGSTAHADLAGRAASRLRLRVAPGAQQRRQRAERAGQLSRRRRRRPGRLGRAGGPRRAARRRGMRRARAAPGTAPRWPAPSRPTPTTATTSPAWTGTCASCRCACSASAMARIPTPRTRSCGRRGCPCPACPTTPRRRRSST